MGSIQDCVQRIGQLGSMFFKIELRLPICLGIVHGRQQAGLIRSSEGGRDRQSVGRRETLDRLD